jgi:hypothetical protein
MHGFLLHFTEPFVSALPVVEAVAPLECLEDRRVIDGIGSSSSAAGCLSSLSSLVKPVDDCSDDCAER